MILSQDKNEIELLGVDSKLWTILFKVKISVNKLLIDFLIQKYNNNSNRIYINIFSEKRKHIISKEILKSEAGNILIGRIINKLV